MDLKYYVLGAKNNKMLQKYRTLYYELLQEQIHSITENELKNALFKIKHNQKFLLNSDNSSRIEYFFLVGNGEEKLDKHDNILETFLRDIENYKTWKLKDIHEYIGNTHISLTHIDKNPYNGLETHPDNIQNKVSLGYGIKDKKYWIDLYTKAFGELQSLDEGIFEELNFIIQKIIPLGTSNSIHNSASYKESIGQLYMGLLISKSEKNEIISVLEGLIHESSHNKLNLISKFDQLLLNDFEIGYYSPYRPDARHVRGVFLGIHAFVPTIFYLLKYYKEKGLNDEHLLEKLVIYNIKNNLSFKILKKYGKFTHIGNEILEEISYVMNETNQLLKIIHINKKILEIAKEKVKQHFGETKNQYPNLKY